MKRSDKTKIEKRLAPFWLYFKLITALGLIVSLIVLYLHSSQCLFVWSFTVALTNKIRGLALGLTQLC